MLGSYTWVFTVLDEVAVARRPPSSRFLFYLSPRSDSLTFSLVLIIRSESQWVRKFRAPDQREPHEMRFHVVLLFYL